MKDSKRKAHHHTAMLLCHSALLMLDSGPLKKTQQKKPSWFSWYRSAHPLPKELVPTQQMAALLPAYHESNNHRGVKERERAKPTRIIREAATR